MAARLTDVQIRLATAADLPAINAIYNHYVLHSTCTYQTEPSAETEREQWFAAHGGPHPVTVAERSDANGPQVIGWGSLSRFHPRSAYRHTTENSIYVRHDLLGRGVGSLLMRDLIDRAKVVGHHSIVALIDADQSASVAMHRRFGFEQAAHLKQVGFKFDRWLDVVYMQLML